MGPRAPPSPPQPLSSPLSLRLSPQTRHGVTHTDDVRPHAQPCAALLRKWRSIALSFNTATTGNDNTCLSNLLLNVNPVRRKVHDDDNVRTFKNETTTKDTASEFLLDHPSSDYIVQSTVHANTSNEGFRLLVAVKLFFKTIIYLEKQYTRIDYSSLSWQQVIGKGSGVVFLGCFTILTEPPVCIRRELLLLKFLTDLFTRKGGLRQRTCQLSCQDVN